jgi:hypothetical protein
MKKILILEETYKLLFENINDYSKWKRKNVTLDEDLWHGTPHDFDEFLLDYMGSGEGVQAFGWGLYFTELEDIAKHYADELGALNAKIYVNGKEINYGHPLFDYQNFLLRANGNVKDVLDDLKNIQNLEVNYPKNSRTIARGKAIEFLEKNPKIKIDQNKYVYKVGFNKIDLDWLEWDKPLKEDQIDKILNQFKIEGYNGRVKYIDNKFFIYFGKEDRREIILGKDFYRALSGDVGFSEKRVSKFLLDLGIQGIKYPAESIAKGKTSESARGYNFVIFDPSIIKIEKKVKY